MNWASCFRNVPGAARSLLFFLFLIINVSSEMRAQAGDDVWLRTVASGSSRQQDAVCSLLRVPESPVNVAHKTLSQKRAEYILGSRLAAVVAQCTELMTDDSIVRYVNRLEQILTSSSQLSGCFVVNVVKDPEPNAYSLPGGFIYITTGLISLLENEGQLIAALAHETAHVAARHQTRLATQARIARRLTLFGGPAGYALRRSLGPVLMFKVVRNYELEADQLGLRYEMAAGYDPFQFSRLLQIAFSEEEEDESFVDRLYCTHPSTNKRIERLQGSLLHSIPPHTSYIVDTHEFSQMKSHLANLMAARENH